MPTTSSRVGAEMVLDVSEPAVLLLSVAVARTIPIFDECLRVTVDGYGVNNSMQWIEMNDGGVIQRLEVPRGRVVITYSATPQASPGSTGSPLNDRELLEYLRPSRFAPSDRLLATAIGHFGHTVDAASQVENVVNWVGNHLQYVLGSSGPVDDAVDSMLLGQGVCRDYAHLVVGLVRALEIPARLAAVYAPGLDPMDFHAVAEAWVEGRWRVIDATHLAPRHSLVRIATGRDAADTAFLTVMQGAAELISVNVTAVAAELPFEDRGAVVHLA